jgi:hypothetical protein
MSVTIGATNAGMTSGATTTAHPRRCGAMRRRQVLSPKSTQRRKPVRRPRRFMNPPGPVKEATAIEVSTEAETGRPITSQHR